MSYEFFTSRRDILEGRIESLQDRLDRISRRRPTAARLAKIEKYEARLENLGGKLESVNDQITALTESKFEFTVGLSNKTFAFERGDVVIGTVDVTVNDSLFDNTYVAGDDFRVRLYAERPYQGRSSTFTAFAAEGEAGGELTARFGGSILGGMIENYDTVTVNFLNSNGDSFFSETFDTATI